MRLRTARLSRGLTLHELAERAGLNVQTVHLLELGRQHRPRPGTMRKIATALGLEVTDIIEFREVIMEREG